MAFILVVWGLYIISAYFSGLLIPRLTASDAPFYLQMAICAVVLLVPVIVWRLKYYNKMFKGADEVTGYITAIRFYRDRGRVRYEYTYKNEKHSAKNRILKSGRTKYYQLGDEITLMVDPENPKKAIIKDIYI
ncbi:DUF3592 domain-containing protein [Methanosarcina sp. T3]|uniref:DUF3592 domain-containing protein n=1 Tax=Methanosarcina sp. T3 TaxID=3439062 RepID=UPI003F85569F